MEREERHKGSEEQVDVYMAGFVYVTVSATIAITELRRTGPDLALGGMMAGFGPTGRAKMRERN